MTTTDRERAVVLGAGIAGLLTARVLADHYAEVLVVDRDPLDTDPPGLDPPGPDQHPERPTAGTVARRGTPQARHLHGLLARGHETLEELLPGLTDQLTAAGAPVGDMLADTRLSFGGHRFQQGPSGLTALCVSRPTLEAAIRRHVAALPAVRLLGERDVVGLTSTRDHHRVVGARIIARTDSSAEEQLPADLVVDTTGRGSRLPRWLDTLGYPPPPEEQIAVGVGYATRRYRLDPDAMGGDLVAISAPHPGRPRGGGLSRIEDGTWLVTLMGILGDHPPTEHHGFTRFAADLDLPDVYHLLQQGTPLDDPVSYRHPTSVRRRYDKLTRFPDGLLVLGDAVCTLNPIYGQGMTVAALEAATLQLHLARGRRVRSHQILRDTGRISGLAWVMARGADLTFPDVDGPRSPGSRLLAGYLQRVQAGAEHDPRLGAAFLRVTGLVDPPPALFRPSVLARTLAAKRPEVAGSAATGAGRERHAG